MGIFDWIGLYQIKNIGLYQVNQSKQSRSDDSKKSREENLSLRKCPEGFSIYEEARRGDILRINKGGVGGLWGVGWWMFKI